VEGRRVCVKEFRSPGFFNRIEALFGSGRARRAWVAGHALTVRGVGTIRTLGLLEDLGLFGAARGYVVSDFVEGAVSLKAYVKQGADARGVTPPERRELTVAMARYVRRLHATGLYHSDLAPKNLLMRRSDTAGWEFWLVDLDAVSLWRRLTARRRRKGLAQLNDLVPSPSRTDRLRFWIEYWGRGREYPREAFGAVGRLTEKRNL